MRFRDHRVVGDILELAGGYRDQGADELVFYDISASPEGRSVDRQWVRQLAAGLDIPFTVAGGIRSLAEAETLLELGAARISINTPALANPGLIDELAGRLGSRHIVVGIDSHERDGDYHVYQDTGDPEKMSTSGRRTAAWIEEVQDRGAGEVVLNCMNQDGVRQGYDIVQLKTMRRICKVALVASGGAGTMEHFAAVYREAGVDGALAASVFHNGTVRVDDLKTYLRAEGIKA